MGNQIPYLPVVIQHEFLEIWLLAMLPRTRFSAVEPRAGGFRTIAAAIHAVPTQRLNGGIEPLGSSFVYQRVNHEYHVLDKLYLLILC